MAGMFFPSLFMLDTVSARDILDDPRDDCRKIEQKLPAGWTIKEGGFGPCSLIVPADTYIEIIDDVGIIVPGVDIDKYSSESQAHQGFQVERDTSYDSVLLLSPQEGSSSLLDPQAKLTILRNVPNFYSSAGPAGANIDIKQIFGKCVLLSGGSSGDNPSDLFSFLNYIHDDEDVAAAESGKQTFLGDHRGFDHAQLDRLIRDTNDVLQQAAMAAVDVCGQDIPAQPAETSEKSVETTAQEKVGKQEPNAEEIFGYEGCVNRCNLETGILKEYCDKRATQEEKNSCTWDIEYATGQCTQACYVTHKLSPKISAGKDVFSGGKLSFDFPTARESAIDRITEGKSDEFFQKSFDEQNRMLDEYLAKNPLDTLTFTLPNGEPIEVEVRDIPIVDAIEDSLKAVANNDADAISKINERWVQNEGTFLYHPIFKQYQSLYQITKENHYEPNYMGPLYFEFVESEEPITFSISPNECCQSIIYGTDSHGKPITDPGMIVTVPEAWQIIKIQDTAAAVGPNSQVKLTGADSVDLSRGVIEIQRPDTPSQSSFTVQTPLGTVTSNKTRYWVAYNPLKGYVLIGVWEGEVVLTNAFTDKTTTLEPLENGNPGIAVLLQPQEKTKQGDAWIWIVMLIVAGGTGYFAYRNKDKIIALLKKPKTDI